LRKTFLGIFVLGQTFTVLDKIQCHDVLPETFVNQLKLGSFVCNNLFISLRLRFYASGESGMDYLFLKSVYCLSGLGIVRKNRCIPRPVNSKKMIVSSRVNYLYINFCSFFTIL
jgi:hypothetical protein